MARFVQCTDGSRTLYVNTDQVTHLSLSADGKTTVIKFGFVGKEDHVIVSEPPEQIIGKAD